VPLSSFEPGNVEPDDHKALASPDSLIAAYFNSATIGFGILDTQLRYLSLNQALATMNGRPARDHIGKGVREVLGDAADQIEAHLRAAIATGTPILNFETTVEFAEKGRQHWISHFFPTKDEAGNVTRIGVVVIEVTEQKKLRQDFQALQETLRKGMERLQMLQEVITLLSSNWELPQVFPGISARIRRVLQQEYASFALHDTNSGLLVRQAMDFPLGKGFVAALHVAATDTLSAHALQNRMPTVFSKEDMQSFEGETAQSFLAEGLQSLCYVPLLRPKGALGLFVLGSTRKEAFRSGDLQLLEQVAAQLSIAIENHRAAAEISALKDRLGEERKYIEGETRSKGQFAEIVGESEALRQVLDQVAIVSSSGATVLILGETGTGKELIAKAIHRMSTRRHQPFIKLNCAAIPTGLLESELFGHERGAFTGAVTQKIGRWELADGGTLFLDEVGEIPQELQPKLLRVLQDHEFERLGSNRTIRVDLRLVTATNRDLAREVAENRFRSDLYYRLSVFPIHLPSLRQRKEDIPLLVRHFVRKFASHMNRNIETIPAETIKRLSEWSWPGNVRELENLMERSVILSEGNALHVPLAEMQPLPSAQGAAEDPTLDNAERQHILRILREAQGVLSGPKGAATRLGLKRTTLQSKMHRLKITRSDYSD
jgi:formate hydrogenlyase transcriptional activator